MNRIFMLIMFFLPTILILCNLLQFYKLHKSKTTQIEILRKIIYEENKNNQSNYDVSSTLEIIYSNVVKDVSMNEENHLKRLIKYVDKKLTKYIDKKFTKYIDKKESNLKSLRMKYEEELANNYKKELDNRKSITVVNLFNNKIKKQCTQSSLILLLSISIIVGFNKIANKPMPVAACAILILLLISLYIYIIVIDYRIRHGYFCSNETEARQFLRFIMDDLNNIDDGNGNIIKVFNSDIICEEVRKIVDNYAVKGWM